MLLGQKRIDEYGIALTIDKRGQCYITHGYGDHFFGLKLLLDRFPNAKAIATAGLRLRNPYAFGVCHIHRRAKDRR